MMRFSESIIHESRSVKEGGRSLLEQLLLVVNEDNDNS